MFIGILLGIGSVARYQEYSIGMKSCSTCGFLSLHLHLDDSSCLCYSLRDFIVIVHCCSGLRGNMLSGTLSRDICQLTGLWYLWVPQLKQYVVSLLVALHDYICFDLCFLWFFSDVRGNNLTGTIPDNIGNCTSFEILYVMYFIWYSCVMFNIWFPIILSSLSLYCFIEFQGHIV